MFLGLSMITDQDKSIELDYKVIYRTNRTIL